MKRKWLAIGISIFAVILLTLTSLSNVVGYQTVQSSNQSIIKERINQRELLFQTIVDIANNKEIQRVILKSQMSRGIFPPSEFLVVTKNQIRQLYFLGLILSKFISMSRIQSMIGKYQFNNQEIQKEINAVIEKNPTLEEEISQLSILKCDCQKSNDEICTILLLIMLVIAAPPLMLLQAILLIFKYTFWYLYLFLYYTLGAPFLLILGCCWYMWTALNCTIGVPEPLKQI